MAQGDKDRSEEMSRIKEESTFASINIANPEKYHSRQILRESCTT